MHVSPAMRRHRIITLVAGVIGAIVLLALLVERKPPHLTVAPLGRVVYEHAPPGLVRSDSDLSCLLGRVAYHEGSPGYLFAVTNHTSLNLEVALLHVGTTHTCGNNSYLKPMTGCWLQLCPLEEGVR